MTAQLMPQNLPIVSCSFGIFCVLRHPYHFVLAAANNRNVIITYRFLAAPVQANRDFFQTTSSLSFFLPRRAKRPRHANDHDKTFETFDGRVYEVFRVLYFSDECNRLKTAFSRLKYPKHVNSNIKSFVDSKVCDRQQPLSPVKETDDRVRVVLPSDQISAEASRYCYCA